MTTSVTSLSAQQAITNAQFPYGISKTIVKEHIFPNTVSYVETTESHYFAYADASMVISYHEIDKNIFVLDFKLLKDTVYFCGYDITNGCNGVWGFFSVADLQSNTMSYDSYSDFTCNNQYVDTLHGIVVYYTQSTKHIVTVGTTTDGATVKNGCTIDVTPSSGGVYTWDYTIGVTPDSTGENIRYACETDNLVVTAGSYANIPGHESYRVHLKNNIFTTGGPQDDIWYFSFSVFEPYKRNSYKFAITHMNGDTVAMALQSFMTGNASNPYYILFYEYDMSTLTNGVINTISSLAVPTYQYPLDVEGLVYSGNSNRLSLLVKGSLPLSPLYGYGSIVAELTPGSTTANLHGLKNIELHSIDNYNTQQNYLCLGVDMTNYQNAMYYSQPLNLDISCTSNLPIRGQSPFFMTKQDHHPYILCSDSFNCNNNKPVMLKQTPNHVICQ